MGGRVPLVVRAAQDGDGLDEEPGRTLPGWATLAAGGLLLSGGLALSAAGLSALSHPHGTRRALVGAAVLLILLAITCFRGLISVSPGEAVVLRLGGSYRGTVRRPGLWWVNPASRKSRVSLRIRNHESGLLKVNDAEGNPIELAGAVMWRVAEPARALLAVDDYVELVRLQTEAAIRHLASGYAYDSRGGDAPSLRNSASGINHELPEEISARVVAAGAIVIEARLTRLSYAPEIAQAMLRVQQANAVVAARHRIVEGAVGIVELALDRPARDSVVELDAERKAAMVSNLLVVLCSDHDPQPVVNSGSLY